ncbi:MAG: putative toxin-antitoxin system toxin component, PIN family [Proteobacteria bacterium]|nr:putative toxin-antitoxin system toxin component, PIN family [Pseudomonadota bacterium]
MRVVIDTNVIVSYILGSRLAPKKVLDLVGDDSIVPVLSKEILNEVSLTLSKDKIRKYLIEERKTEVMVYLYSAMAVEIDNVVDQSRDKDDNMALETAHKGNAKYIITGDQDLLVLKQYKGISIVTPNDFITLFMPSEMRTSK